jgi:bacteriocin-like protein
MDEHICFESSSAAPSPDGPADARVELTDEELEHVVGGLARAWPDGLSQSARATVYDSFAL